MATTYQILYWRDIPVQVKILDRRARASRPLTERFQAAVDRAAMGSGLSNTDDYLNEWRTSEAKTREGEPDEVAAAVAAELEAAYSTARLDVIAANAGREP